MSHFLHTIIHDLLVNAPNYEAVHVWFHQLGTGCETTKVLKKISYHYFIGCSFELEELPEPVYRFLSEQYQGSSLPTRVCIGCQATTTPPEGSVAADWHNLLVGPDGGPEGMSGNFAGKSGMKQSLSTKITVMSDFPDGVVRLNEAPTLNVQVEQHFSLLKYHMQNKVGSVHFLKESMEGAGGRLELMELGKITEMEKIMELAKK